MSIRIQRCLPYAAITPPCAPTTRSSASCARSAVARASSGGIDVDHQTAVHCSGRVSSGKEAIRTLIDTHHFLHSEVVAISAQRCSSSISTYPKSCGASGKKRVVVYSVLYEHFLEFDRNRRMSPNILLFPTRVNGHDKCFPDHRLALPAFTSAPRGSCRSRRPASRE
jgi:hypothetical protein